MRRAWPAAAALVALVGGVAGCGSPARDNAATGPPPAAAPSAAPRPRPTRPPAGDAAAAVAKALAAHLPEETGAAVAALDGGRVVTVGARAPTPAWSTMKLPLIVTVLRERRVGALPGGTEPTAPEQGAIRRAITASDNAAAQTLYGELTARYGGDAGATRRIDRTLRLAGDGVTHVNAGFTRPGFSNFGQSRWGLREMALFYRALAVGGLLAAADRDVVLGAMASVDGNQRWGARTADWPSAGAALVKGGWGPTPAGAYDVLQAAIVRGHDGVVLTVATVAPTFADGQQRITSLARVAADALRLHR